MPLSPGARLGQYEVVALLGAGGMGEVYQARHDRLGRLVALKILNADALSDAGRKRRFVQEAQAASALNHPGIVTIYDIADEAGMDFIVMEYVEGKTLDQLIGRKGLSLKKTLDYAVQAASALAKAHGAGIVHRDLKPSNIMVTDDEQVKILDFGLAKLLSSDEGDLEADAWATTHTVSIGAAALLTEGGKIVGTAAYMSPEQAEGKKVDQRSDVFSFGSVLYEMVTGIRAFQGESSVSTLSAVLGKEPKPPSQLVANIPRELERIILRCLRKDPARRFQVMADLVVELEEIKAESSSQITPVHPPPFVVRKGKLLGAAAVLTLMATIAWLAWPTAPLLPAPRVLQFTSYPGDERFPDFSPDGHQVAFTWNGEKQDNRDIYITQLGVGTPMRLTTDPAEDIAPAWSADGTQIAFIRLRREGAERGTLYRTSVVGGAETRIAEIMPPPDLPSVSWFPDGKRLAVAQLKPGTDIYEIAFIHLERYEHRTLISSPLSAGRYISPTVSPDGERVAYGLCKGIVSNPSCDIYVVGLKADLSTDGEPQRLTHTGAFVGRLVWTPDSRTVISAAGLGGLHLWRVPVSGGNPERIEIAGTPATHPAVSLRGNKLVFSRRAKNMDLWRFDTEGNQPALFASSTLDDEDPQFSPDGRKVAFASNRSGRMTIWVANHDGTSPVPVTQGTERLQGSPRWSPDSRFIAYDAQGDDGHWDIYVIDGSGGQPRQLTKSPEDETVPSWSRDSNWIYFRSNRTGRLEVWRSPARGGDAVQITHDGGGTSWESIDGTTLFYVRGAEIFAKPLPDGAARKLPFTVYNSDYFPIENGIFYIAEPDPKRPYAFELRFFDLIRLTNKSLNRFEVQDGHGLSVSPDRKTVLYSAISVAAGTDLMLIENFR